MLPHREHHLVNRESSQGSAVSVESLKARYGIDGNHRVILYAGTFEAYQGLDLLVDASSDVIHKLKSCRFLCLGGNRDQVAKIRMRAHERGVAEHFILPGTVPFEEVDHHLAIASVLVSPRISGTNTPLKIYSYLRSGVPMIATNIRSHTQVLTPEVALLVEPRPECLAAGILTLLDDHGLSHRLAQSALRLAREAYSAEAYHRKVAEVFTFLAARSRRRSRQPFWPSD